MRIKLENLTDEQLNALSRTTRWRARRRGWACPDYRTRTIKQSANADAALIIEAARIGAAKAYRALHVLSLAPFEFADLVQQAALRLVELAGHERFHERGFRINTAFNAARAFIRVHVYNQSVKHARSASERKAMNYTKTNEPRTQTILRAWFTISAGLVSYIENLNLSGPGTWAEAHAGGGKVRVYHPDDLQAGQVVYGTIQRHTSPQGREYKRIIFSPTTIDEANVLEMSEATFIAQAARFLGACDAAVRDMLGAAGLDEEAAG